MKNGPIDGYARTVHYLVTGEKIIDNESENILESREREEKDNGYWSVSCSPNPATTSLFLEIAEELQSSYDYTLMDMGGIKILENTVKSNDLIGIDVSGIAPGIYLLKVNDINAKVVHMEKISIIK